MMVVSTASFSCAAPNNTQLQYISIVTQFTIVYCLTATTSGHGTGNEASIHN